MTDRKIIDPIVLENKGLLPDETEFPTQGKIKFFLRHLRYDFFMNTPSFDLIVVQQKTAHNELFFLC